MRRDFADSVALVQGVKFAIDRLVEVAVRALFLSLIRGPLGWLERAAAWLAPKGFAWVAFGQQILKES